MLKVGIIGLGMISHENVLGYLDSDDAEIIAVCDVDEEVGRRCWKPSRSHRRLPVLRIH